MPQRREHPYIWATWLPRLVAPPADRGEHGPEAHLETGPRRPRRAPHLRRGRARRHPQRKRNPLEPAHQKHPKRWQELPVFKAFGETILASAAKLD